jgi:hypothetical protein
MTLKEMQQNIIVVPNQEDTTSTLLRLYIKSLGVETREKYYNKFTIRSCKEQAEE